ncbi:hypothetical protein [Listeria seeligeri]|uniref:hypothetical protein n=1 Tax=Listeria seeligeri TaxID=1640 RepID=UPI001E45BB01|nr:hypothetical protein [Listeria seeligeri]
MAQVAACNITVAQIEHPEGYVAGASRIEMLHVMDIIYSVYISTYDETIAAKISRTRPYFKKKRGFRARISCKMGAFFRTTETVFAVG